IVYCAENIALALLESLSHLGLGKLPYDRYLVKIEVPNAIWAARRQLTQPPGGWDAIPFSLSAMQAGDAWLAEGKSALMVVPSVIVPEERNILVNPAHPDAALLGVRVMRRWVYDPRFF